MAISNYLEAAILNAVFRNTPYTSPSKVYVALYTSNPTDADTGTEVSGGAYARQVATFTAPVQGTPDTAASIENSTEIAFPIATADWGTVTHVGIKDALTGGNLLYHGPVENPRSFRTNDRAKYPQGTLKLTLD